MHCTRTWVRPRNNPESGATRLRSCGICETLAGCADAPQGGVGAFAEWSGDTREEAFEIDS